MRSYLLILCTILTLVGCKKDDDDSPQHFDRTVLIYIAGENNLAPYINEELREMVRGSYGIGNNALVVYVDGTDDRPYIMRLVEGEKQNVHTLESDGFSSDPDVMREVLNYTAANYPADDYGLVLWGHATGWEIEDSTYVPSSKRAYGIDNGGNTTSNTGRSMNMYTLAQTLKAWGQPLRFILADCCQFQCVESAYELRNATDYIIGSPAEIPGIGAPYDQLGKAFFSKDEHFYESIVDEYFEQVTGDGSQRTPLSVIKTSKLDTLAFATEKALKTFLPLADGTYPKMDGLLYYRGNTSDNKASTMYDMNDFMLHYTDSAAYANWKKVFDQTVIYRKHPDPSKDETWMTNHQIKAIIFTYVTDERYGGISMFVPQDRTGSWYQPFTQNGVKHDGYNADIKKTSWYWAAGLDDLGW